MSAFFGYATRKEPRRSSRPIPATPAEQHAPSLKCQHHRRYRRVPHLLTTNGLKAFPPSPLLLDLLHLGEEGAEDDGEFLDLRGRTARSTSIEVSTKNGDAMVTKNLEMLKGLLPT
jgi:hypothetical protein